MKTLSNNMNRWQAFFLAFVFSFALPFTARAQDALKPEDAKTYSELLKRAQLAADNNKIDEAIGLWMQAWKIQPHWHLPCYIGTGHFLLHRPDKTATYLTRCLKLAPFPTTPKGAEHRRKEREMLEAALDHVAAVTITAPHGARVTVDTEERGTAPLSEEVFLMPGEHRFVAELNGRTVTRTLSTKRREKHNIDLVFAEDKPEPVAPKPIETKPVEPKPINKKPVEIARAVPMALSSDPLAWSKRWVPSIALLGTSALMAGGGVWLWLEADEQAYRTRDLAAAKHQLPSSATNAECNALTAQFIEARADSRRFKNANGLLFGGAALLGAAGLVYPWLPFHYGKSTSIAVSPSSIQVRGSF